MFKISRSLTEVQFLTSYALCLSADFNARSMGSDALLWIPWALELICAHTHTRHTHIIKCV